MVMTPDNKTIFPFFINIDNHLLISHNFIRLMGLFYYPFYYNDLFNKAIEKHSEYFEKELVPEKLEELGFKVIKDYKDKKNASLQIDQIAWKGEKLFVIETKVWDLKPYFEHRRIHEHRERDLKGIVDGKKYSKINGKERVKNIPSLLNKINYVKSHLPKICDEHKSIKDIEGIIITKSHPIIKQYKGIRFLSFSDLGTI